jgi:hypothetical protein
MFSKRRWLVAAALTGGLVLGGSTAAMAGTPSPSPSPSQQTVTPFPFHHHHHVRAALWQFDFTGANIDGLTLNDVRGVGAIAFTRWTEQDLNPFVSKFTSPGNTSSVTLAHPRLPLPNLNPRTCTATFDQEAAFRIIASTGIADSLRVLPGTSDYILRGVISFDRINLHSRFRSVCPLAFVNPWTLRAQVEHNNLAILGHLATLVDFDVQGNALLVRPAPVVTPTPTPTGPGHFFAPSVNSNPDNQMSDDTTAVPADS